MRKYFLTFMMLAAANAAQAQEASKPVKDEPIEVIAEKVESSINTVNADELQKTTANSLNDIYKGNPQVSVGGGGLPLAQKVFVRGVGDSLMNVSIDGATQAGEVYHHQSRIYIDPILLKAVQVEAGAGAVTNGAGALAGAIRYETKDAADLLRLDQDHGFAWRNGYYSNTEGWRSSLSLYGRITDQLDYLAMLSRQDTGNWKDGDGNEWEHSDSTQELGYFKLGFDYDEANRSEISYENSFEEANRYTRTNFNTEQLAHFQPNILLNAETTRETLIFNHTFNPESNDLIDLKFTAFYTENEYERSDYEHSPNVYGGGRIESYGFDLRNTSIVGDHSLTYGTEYRYDKAEGIDTYYGSYGGAEGDPWWNGSNASEDAEIYGIFVHDNWRFHEDWLLSAGVRHDWWEHEDAAGYETSVDGFSANGGLKYFVTDEVTLYGNASRIERGRGVSEAYFASFVDPALGENGPDKEVAQNYEGGFSYDDGSLFFGLEVFKQEVKDVISQDWLYIIGDVETTGYTAHVGYNYENLTVKLSMSDIEAEIDGEEVIYNPYANSSGTSWVFDASYYLESLNLDLGWRSRFVDSLGEFGDYNIASYDVHDLYIQWQPTGQDDWTVNLAVNNVFDRHYYDQATFNK